MPLYCLLADAGVTLDRVQHEITVAIAGHRTAQLLDVAIGTALLTVDLPARMSLFGTTRRCG